MRGRVWVGAPGMGGGGMRCPVCPLGGCGMVYVCAGVLGGVEWWGRVCGVGCGGVGVWLWWGGSGWLGESGRMGLFGERRVCVCLS